MRKIISEATVNSASSDNSSDRDKEKLVQALRYAAMNLLARREHSRKEIRDKLIRKLDPDIGQLDAVLDRLAEQDLLSDQRFGEAFVRWRVARGQGPVRIRMELGERGVDADEALSQCAVDWFTLALEVAEKRFGTSPAVDHKERAKRVRFLQYRGFTGAQVREVLN